MELCINKLLFCQSFVKSVWPGALAVRLTIVTALVDSAIISQYVRDVPVFHPLLERAWFVFMGNA